MKRFYKAAAPMHSEGRWAVGLDGRPVRTPSGGVLALPCEAAAALLAGEWEAQSDPVRPETMPLVRLVNVALDRTPAVREGVADQFAAYGETDVVCHLADAPQELVERQEAGWAPLRDWAATELDVRLHPVQGLLTADQPAESLARLRAFALSLDDIRLTALAHAAAELGSAILALALLHGRLTAAEAHALSVLDAAWQREHWGADAEALDREAAVLSGLEALERLFAALAK